MNVNQCNEGTPERQCPIQKSAFNSGDPVYILNTDFEKAKIGQPVPCASIVGLRTLSMIHKGTGFNDPFHRNPGEKMLCRRDYTMMFAFNDEDLASGICQRVPTMKKKKPKRKSKGAKSADEASGPSQSEAGPSGIYQIS